MYRVIGADDKEYGPFTVDQIRDWIAQRRLNGDSLMCEEGSGAWKPLSQFPEIAGFLASAAIPSSFAPRGWPETGPTETSGVQGRVEGPAIGLIVMAGLGFASQGRVLLIRIFGLSMASLSMNNPGGFFPRFFGEVAGVFGSVVAIGVGLFVLFGALKMKRLESYNWAMAASILAMVPCLSPCCYVGLPVGIWSLIVLTKPGVKSSFTP